MQPQPPSQPNLRLRIAIIVGGIAGIIIVVVLSLPHSATKTTPAAPTTTPNTTSGSGVTYSGLDSLTTIGLTSVQVDDIKFAAFRFIGQLKLKNPVAAVISNPDHQHDITTGNDTYTFTLQLNDLHYSAVATTQDFTSIDLTLANANNAVVFDSGLVDLSSTSNADSN